MQTLTMLFISTLCVFLIGLILLQRGRGGGLAGAFGGMGGQSAFGTKAGDVFTRITVVVATILFLVCIATAIGLKRTTTSLNFGGGGGSRTTTAPMMTPEPTTSSDVPAGDPASEVP